MPRRKLKTNKSARKRFRVTPSGNMVHRAVKQNHYNAGDSGDESRRKHKGKNTPVNELKDLRRLFPYQK